VTESARHAGEARTSSPRIGKYHQQHLRRCSRSRGFRSLTARHQDRRINVLGSTIRALELNALKPRFWLFLRRRRFRERNGLSAFGAIDREVPFVWLNLICHDKFPHDMTAQRCWRRSRCDREYFDLEQKPCKPIDTPFGTRLSPMSQVCSVAHASGLGKGSRAERVSVNPH